MKITHPSTSGASAACSRRPIRRGDWRRALIAAAIFFLALAAGKTDAAEEQPRPPNFVLILADDLGAKDAGCYGSTDVRTPNIDRLARSGVRFETCYATPVCTSSRVMLLAGRYGFRTGFYNFHGRPGAPPMGSPEDDTGAREVTFADLLRERGYRTCVAGRWGLRAKVPGALKNYGFDEYSLWPWRFELPKDWVLPERWRNPKSLNATRYWHPAVMQNDRIVETDENDFAMDIHLAYLLDFIRRNREGPFLAYFPTLMPHIAYPPLPPYPDTPDPDNRGNRVRGSFAAHVRYLDYMVGRLVKLVDELGIRNDTIFIFAADNGTEAQGKATSTELGARVPLIFNSPARLEKGVVSDALVDLTDILPTMVELAGARLPADRTVDGRSFAHVLRGVPGPAREWIFSYLAGDRILRDRRWLLEGDGKFFDCGNSRDRRDYRDVTDSNQPEVIAARARFARILRNLPPPDGVAPGSQYRLERREYDSFLKAYLTREH